MNLKEVLEDLSKKHAKATQNKIITFAKHVFDVSVSSSP